MIKDNISNKRLTKLLDFLNRNARTCTKIQKLENIVAHLNCLLVSKTTKFFVTGSHSRLRLRYIIQDGKKNSIIISFYHVKTYGKQKCKKYWQYLAK